MVRVLQIIRVLMMGFARRCAYFLFIAVFTVAGSPSMSLIGLASTARNEHDVKPSVSEEELRHEAAVPEALRYRLSRNRTQAQASTASNSLKISFRAPRSRCEVVPRRILDKQNGIGAFLRC